MTDSEEPKPPPEKSDRRSKSQQTLIFISHDTRDAELAEHFSKLLSSVSAGVLKSFRSSDKKGGQGIEYGVEWYPELMKRLTSASDVVCLLTQRSLDRPWILYEAGVAKGKLDTPVYGVAFGIALGNANTGPFAQFQNCDDKEESLTKLVMQLVDRIPDSEPDREAILMQVKSFKEHVREALAKPDAPIDETGEHATRDDSSVANLFEEVKVMFQDLPSRVESQLEKKLDPRRRRRGRRLDLQLFHDLIRSCGAQTRNPVELLILASVLRDGFPWLSEIATETFRTIQTGDRAASDEMVMALRRAADFSLQSPIIDHIADSREEYARLREQMLILESFIPMVLDRTMTSLSAKEAQHKDKD